MDIPPLLLQFLVSLAAILALFVLACGLKLGRKTRLIEDESVRDAASEVQDGFLAERIAISRGGEAALARDGSGQVMVIKQHGNRFAGRVLTSAARVDEVVDAIVIDCGDARFGKVRLSIENPGAWVDAINRL